MRLCPRLPGVRLTLALSLAVAVLAARPTPAPAYEFEVLARTLGQGYALRSLRFSGPDLVLTGRRFTQTVNLSIWDLGGRLRDRRLHDIDRKGGPNLSFTGYLRIDHDFGAWSTGSLVLGNRIFDAVDLVPELESTLLDLEILYAYFAAEELMDGTVDIYVGRQLDVDTLDWFSMDGVKVRLRPRAPVAVEAFAGLRVRDASPLGSSVQEPDGTGSGECAEYVEGQIPGSGAWRPIDRQVFTATSRFRNDLDLCPQRQELMPTFGAAIDTRGLSWLWARLAYRRSMSATPGLIGPVDRFENPDTGLYPNELGQAPGWGVNEERLSASLRSNHFFAGETGQITPYGALRYSVLFAALDQGHLGVRLRYGAHSLEPELFYSLPLFDGDSIFNVFSIEPYTDFRLTYDLAPRQSRLGGYARAWMRRFDTEDAPVAGGPGDTAGGVHLGGRFRERKRYMARLDLFYDGGYGGTRAGGFASGTWQASKRAGVSGRLSVIHFDEDLRDKLRGTSLGVQAGATYEIHPGIVLHVMAEDNINPFYQSQFRLLGIVDLAFVPEV
jgi:hypothetical protein